MTESALKKTGPLQGIGAEYTIYVFKKPEEAAGRKSCRWIRHCTSASPAQADKRARVLFRTGRYEKVEIKQMLFDSKQQRMVDVTLKVFSESRTSHPLLAWFFSFIPPRKTTRR